MGEFFLLSPEAPNNILIMASFRSIPEIHVVYSIVPVCGNLAKIDFPLGHFTGIQQFCTGICLNLVPLLCVCCEGGDYSTNAQCPVLALVVPWPLLVFKFSGYCCFRSGLVCCRT